MSALYNFDERIRDDATIFYLLASVKICFERNKIRLESTNSRKGFVPEDILSTYYERDDIDILQKSYPNVYVVENEFYSLNRLEDKLSCLIETIICI